MEKLEIKCLLWTLPLLLGIESRIASEKRKNETVLPSSYNAAMAYNGTTGHGCPFNSTRAQLKQPSHPPAPEQTHLQAQTLAALWRALQWQEQQNILGCLRQNGHP